MIVAESPLFPLLLLLFPFVSALNPIRPHRGTPFVAPPPTPMPPCSVPFRLRPAASRAAAALFSTPPGTGTDPPRPPIHVAEGHLAIDKPLGWTSQDVVSHVRHVLERDARSRGALPPGRRGRKPPVRVGHGGTLDPLATGVLVVGVGPSGTKGLEGLLKGDKRYACEMALHFGTDTLDLDGEVTNTDSPGNHQMTAEDVRGVLGAFRGEIEQVPPIYSALKVGGKKLYELARDDGKTEGDVEIKTRRVNVYELDLIEEGHADFDRVVDVVAADREVRARVAAETAAAEAAAAAEEKGALAGTEPVAGTGDTPRKKGRGRSRSREPKKPRRPTLTSDSAYAAASAATQSSSSSVFRLSMSVGGGTYVRSLVRDVGAALGTCATMTGLVRTKHGPYGLGDCLEGDPKGWSAEDIYGAVSPVVEKEVAEEEDK